MKMDTSNKTKLRGERGVWGGCVVWSGREPAQITSNMEAENHLQF